MTEEYQLISIDSQGLAIVCPALKTMLKTRGSKNVQLELRNLGQPNAVEFAEADTLGRSPDSICLPARSLFAIFNKLSERNSNVRRRKTGRRYHRRDH